MTESMSVSNLEIENNNLISRRVFLLNMKQALLSDDKEKNDQEKKNVENGLQNMENELRDIEIKLIQRGLLDTGSKLIDRDFGNMFLGIGMSYRGYGIEFVKEMFKKGNSAIPRYEEKYIVNEENKNIVMQINDLANKMNEMVNNPDSIDEDEFIKTYNSLHKIVSGESGLLVKGSHHKFDDIKND